MRERRVEGKAPVGGGSLGDTDIVKLYLGSVKPVVVRLVLLKTTVEGRDPSTRKR